MGVRATAYTAYNFVTGPGCPTGMTVADQMATAAADAVDLLVVVNQNGAQNSNSTIGVVYDDVRAYLRSAAGGTWNATIIGALQRCRCAMDTSDRGQGLTTTRKAASSTGC